MNTKTIRSMFYGIVTDTKGTIQYLGRDDNSGGYPFLSIYPVIFHDTNYLESHRIDSYLKQIVDGGKYTLRIYEVNPTNNTVTEVGWGGLCPV